MAGFSFYFYFKKKNGCSVDESHPELCSGRCDLAGVAGAECGLGGSSI